MLCQEEGGSLAWLVCHISPLVRSMSASYPLINPCVLSSPPNHPTTASRYVPMFGDTEYDSQCDYGAVVPLEEQLEALGRAQREGKVRHVGLSNETPWGLMRCLCAGE